MAKLDKSRPYGEVYGDANGVRFVQDGLQFDATGNLIGEPGQETKPRGRRPKAAVMSADEQLAANLGEPGGLESN